MKLPTSLWLWLSALWPPCAARYSPSVEPSFPPRGHHLDAGQPGVAHQRRARPAPTPVRPRSKSAGKLAPDAVRSGMRSPRRRPRPSAPRACIFSSPMRRAVAEHQVRLPVAASAGRVGEIDELIAGDMGAVDVAADLAHQRHRVKVDGAAASPSSSSSRQSNSEPPARNQ